MIHPADIIIKISGARIFEFTLHPDGSIDAWHSHRPQPSSSAILAGIAAAKETERVAKINGEASDRILAICPLWKQTNYLARALELKTAGRALTDSENGELAAIEAAWVRVQAIRAYSNTLCADATITHPHWPN